MTFIFLIASCSDNSSNTTVTEERSCDLSFPSEFAPVTVDLSYFVNQSQQEEPDPENDQFSTYYEVEELAAQANKMVFENSLMNLASSFISHGSRFANDPTFENGACVWESINPPPGLVGGLEFSVTVRGRSTGEELDWEIIYDGDLPDSGSLDEFRLITGRSSKNNLNGEWNLFVPSNPNEPALTYSWSIQSDNNYEFNVTADPDEFGILVVNYMKQEVDNNVTYDEGTGLKEVYWNEETNSGWIQDSQRRKCYDNLLNSECE
ncbi:hypothetical protein [Rhodohalobacter sulfatireducens]|uniref:Lipoprotein n=1 Tax=Rhodohalobacter sulfatireducens TaxID=2911366 RepID=A0ABS9KG58_9BACT|nr:hypothetical protein [Rhodohalobacter sulfatireducens]MCG2589821.1 hypothetical protein [Rhodohalobacter sulfatireducens]